jgi:hypothetical protein
MFKRILAALILLPVVGLLIYTVLLNPSADASSQQPTVVSKTTGSETLKAELVNNEVKISLKNNHKQTITAYTISYDDTQITEDFAYSDVHSGIAPGDVYEKSYSFFPSSRGSVPTLYLLTVVLEDGGHDGDADAARKIKDERLGEKIQVLRTLRIIESHKNTPSDLKRFKDDVSAALNTAESETLMALDELQPVPSLSAESNNKKLSDDVRAGLQVGREKMLRRVEVLEKVPSDSLDRAFSELRRRSSNLLAKL